MRNYWKNLDRIPLDTFLTTDYREARVEAERPAGDGVNNPNQKQAVEWEKVVRLKLFFGGRSDRVH